METQELINQVNNELGTNFTIENFSFYNLAAQMPLTEAFIEKYSEYLNWTEVSWYQNLSEDFIEKNIDKISFINISARQKLSVEFIRKHKDKLDWHNISNSQVLSEDAILEFKDYLCFECFSMFCPNPSISLLKKVKNYLQPPYYNSDMQKTEKLNFYLINKAYNLKH